MLNVHIIMRIIIIIIVFTIIIIKNFKTFLYINYILWMQATICYILQR